MICLLSIRVCVGIYVCVCVKYVYLACIYSSIHTNDHKIFKGCEVKSIDFLCFGPYT